MKKGDNWICCSGCRHRQVCYSGPPGFVVVSAVPVACCQSVNHRRACAPLGHVWALVGVQGRVSALKGVHGPAPILHRQPPTPHLLPLHSDDNESPTRGLTVHNYCSIRSISVSCSARGRAPQGLNWVGTDNWHWAHRFSSLTRERECDD